MSGFLIGLIVVVHVVVCVALMASILLQSGKGGGLAGAFGAGSSQTLFGGRGAATFLSRATTVLAVVFFVTSLTLGLNASRAGGRASLMQQEARRRGAQPRGTGATAPPATTPANPAAPAGPLAPGTGSPSAPAGGATNPAPGETPPAQGPASPPSGGTSPAPSSGGQ